MPIAPVLNPIGPITGGSVPLFWSQVTGAIGYRIYRSAGVTPPDPLQDIPIASVTTTEFVDDIGDGLWTYVVTAYDDTGESDPSNPQTAMIRSIDTRVLAGVTEEQNFDAGVQAGVTLSAGFDTIVQTGEHQIYRMDTVIETITRQVSGFDTRIMIPGTHEIQFDSVVQAGIEEEGGFDAGVKTSAFQVYMFDTRVQPNEGTRLVQYFDSGINTGIRREFRGDVRVETTWAAGTDRVVKLTFETSLDDARVRGYRIVRALGRAPRMDDSPILEIDQPTTERTVLVEGETLQRSPTTSIVSPWAD